MHGEGDHHLNPNIFLGVQSMSRIGKDLELRPVKPSPVVRSIIVIGVRAKARRAGALETRP